MIAGVVRDSAPRRPCSRRPASVPQRSSATRGVHRRSGRSGRTMPALVSVTSVWSLVVSLVASCAGERHGAHPFIADGSSHTRWRPRRVSMSARMSRGAARVEEDVALADGRLLLQQARVEQRLPHLLRERAVVAREAAREVGEVGVVAAPLAHAVEPLEDPAGDAAGRDPGPRAGARRRRPAPSSASTASSWLRRRRRRAAAEARDGLGDPQRVPGADRLACSATSSSSRGGQRDARAARRRSIAARRARRRPARRAPRGRTARRRRRVGEHEEAAGSSPARSARSCGPAGAPGSASSTSAPTVAATSSHSRSPAALGVGAQRRGGGRGGEQAAVVGGDADLDGLVRSRERGLAELVAPVRAAPR